MSAEPKPTVRLFPAFLMTTAAFALAGCTQWQSAAWDTASHIVRPGSAVDQAPLRQDLRYLRVTTNGTPALLVLGDIDRDAAGRTVQVWYSAGREVLRLQDGRLVGLSGTPVEWRDVKLPAGLATWQNVKAPVTYVRQRDQMPGYRIGLQEQVTVRPIAAPTGGTRLLDADPAALQWYEETTSAVPDAPPALAAHFRPLPPARFAVRETGHGVQPVYGEQCLDAALCIQWQTWPPRLSEN